MLRKSLLLFTQFLLLCLTANSAVFVVTSNADSGPGTLRQALLDATANGDVEKDYINFNINDLSELGRTIKSLTNLPDIPSNIDIDGTTQPGNKFGVSQSKVKILMAVPNAGINPHCMYIYNKFDVGIYGLLIDADFSLFQNGSFSSGIYIVGSQRIQIGTPGKGNVIKNFEVNINAYLDFTGVENPPITEDVKVQSNFLAINEDGKTICLLGRGQLEMASVRNFTFGGSNPSEGNIVYGMVRLLHYNNIRRFNLGDLIVGNNIFGLDYLGENPIGDLSDATQISSFAVIDHPGDLDKCDIFNNTSTGSVTLQTGGFFTIRGNKFGTDITGTKIIPRNTSSIVLGYCTGGGKIGGTNPGDQNIFAGSYQPDYVPLQYGAVIDNVSSQGVEIVGNIFKCNNGLRPIRLSGVVNNVPVIKSHTNTDITGTAPANARVDLYYSIECEYCEPQVFINSVIANSSGDWKYTGVLTNKAIIAATTIAGATSEFTGLYFTNAQADVKIGNACTGHNGYIKGVTSNGAKAYSWYNESGTLVGSAPELTEAMPGKYHLIISDDYCSISSPVYEIKLVLTQIDDSRLDILNASCSGLYDGRIIGLQAPIGATFLWKNESGTIVRHDIDLNDVPAGRYFLTVTAANANCTEIYGPVTIANASGPNINQASPVISPTNCGQSNGSITGITATGTGTLKYSWKNEQQQEVGTSLNLINQPAGRYTLQVTDDNQCGPVYSTALEITNENGITLDESTILISIASCSNNNGAITGIKAPGATIYKWVNANNVTVSGTLNLSNVPSGDYTFTASNTFGCIQIKTYHVGQQAATVYPVYSSTIVNACYGMANGSISVVPNSLVKSVRWANSADVTVASGNTLINRAPGIYKLYFTDINGCESLYDTYNITQIAELKIFTASVVNDACGLKTGSIQSVQITGGVPPYTYTWFNAGNTIVGTSANIDHLAGGTYRLVVTDSRNCAQPSATYTVLDNSELITPPTAADIQTCAPGKVTLTVNNATPAYSYRLYTSANAATPIDEQSSGRFIIDVVKNTDFFITQLQGTCESIRTEVKVTVGVSSLDIANAFTPNADGINDVWKIAGIESSPNAVVQVFNRAGQMVFNSKGYATPFNGTLNGKELPVGNYYYIINMGTSGCNLLSGALTIMR